MSPSRSNTIVWPSGETSTDIQVPSVAVERDLARVGARRVDVGGRVGLLVLARRRLRRIGAEGEPGEPQAEQRPEGEQRLAHSGLLESRGAVERLPDHPGEEGADYPSRPRRVVNREVIGATIGASCGSGPWRSWRRRRCLLRRPAPPPRAAACWRTVRRRGPTSRAEPAQAAERTGALRAFRRGPPIPHHARASAGTSRPASSATGRIVLAQPAPSSPRTSPWPGAPSSRRPSPERSRTASTRGSSSGARGTAALDRGTIVSHAANVHVIPATSRLRTAVRCVSEGDDVRLEGWLVDVDGVERPELPLGDEHDARGRGAQARARRSTSSG